MLGRRILVRQHLSSDTGGGQPYLASPKTAAGVREVPLADETLEVLAEHMAAFPPVEVEVEDRTGTRPVRRSVRLVFYAVEETRAGVRRTPLRRLLYPSFPAPALFATGDKLVAETARHTKQELAWKHNRE